MKAINTSEAMNYVMDLMVTFGDQKLVTLIRNQNINAVDPSGYLVVTPANFVLSGNEVGDFQSAVTKYYEQSPDFYDKLKNAKGVLFFGTTISGDYYATIETYYKNAEDKVFCTKNNNNYGIAGYSQDDTLLSFAKVPAVAEAMITFNGWLFVFKPND